MAKITSCKIDAVRFRDVVHAESKITRLSRSGIPAKTYTFGIDSEDRHFAVEMSVEELETFLNAWPELKAIVDDARRYRFLRGDGSTQSAYLPEEEGVWGGEELDILCDDKGEGRRWAR